MNNVSGRMLVKKTDGDIINRGRNTLAGRRHNPAGRQPYLRAEVLPYISIIFRRKDI